MSIRHRPPAFHNTVVSFVTPVKDLNLESTIMAGNYRIGLFLLPSGIPASNSVIHYCNFEFRLELELGNRTFNACVIDS